MPEYTEICKIFHLSPNENQERAWISLSDINKKSLFTKRKSHGCYIYGGVGVGKTTIAKIFFDKFNSTKKIQIHLSTLLWEINRKINHAKKMNFSDPMIWVFKEFKSLKLIFIDEFEINDIVSSILIRRLLDFLLKNHCTIIITSNKHPDDLYKEGLQKEKFTEFVDFMKTKINIINYDGEDYRRKASQDRNNIKISSNNDHDILLQKLINITDNISKKILTIASREIKVDHFEDIAILNFNEICKKPHASQDYEEICNNFTAIAITEIPDFTTEDRNSILRFCILIDHIYDRSRKFYGVCMFDFNRFNPELRVHDVPQIKRCISRMIELDRMEWKPS